MQNTEQNWDCVIIGGGIAGLIASIYLARAEKSVLILEKAKTLGGRGRTTVKMDSYLNLGPHALYSKGLAIETLRELGIELEGGIVPTRGKMIHNGEIFDIPASPFILVTSTLLNWNAKKELLSFFLKYKKMKTDGFKNVPLAQWLQHRIKDKLARNLILMLSRLSSYSDESDRLSAGAAIKQLQLGNAMYLNKGWQSMIDALINKAVEFGVQFQTGKHVNKVTGSFPDLSVQTNKEIIYAKNVLSTSSPQETSKLLKEYKCTPEFIKKDYIPVHAACLDLVLSKVPNPNIDFAMGVEDPFYFSNHSKIAKLSNQDHQVIHVMKYGISNQETEKELEEFMEIVQPGWEEFVIYKRYLPRMTVSNRLVLASNDDEVSPLVSQIPGFYIAGDWVGDAMLAEASFQSGRKAAQFILEKFSIKVV